jgi:hypothetical protein
VARTLRALAAAGVFLVRSASAQEAPSSVHSIPDIPILAPDEPVSVASTSTRALRLAPRTSEDGADEDHVQEDKREAPRAFRMGPMFGIGAPSVFNVGIGVRVTHHLGASADLGWLPETRVPLQDGVTVSYREYGVTGRVHPFGGAFFLGSSVGYRTLSGTLTRTVNVPEIPGYTSGEEVTVGTSASVRSLMVTPRLGYLYTFGAGFTLGLDAGVQVPISVAEITYETRVPAAVPREYVDLARADEERTLRSLGKQVLPSLALRMGWLF